MNRAVYGRQMPPSQYDDKHALVYLNEEHVNDYQPSEDPEAEPREGYAYSGPMPDGGTLIECEDVTNRDSLINGIIRSRYPQTLEDAIKTHRLLMLGAAVGQEGLDDETIGEYNTEWEEFNAFRDETITLVGSWLE